MKQTKDIETLLNLNDVIIEQTNGYWTKFEVRLASGVTEKIPHGIRYSLTLHDRFGNRVMGFDNAHPIKAKKSKMYQAIKTYDHQHRYTSDTGIPYEFIDAYQLLNDFWSEVDKVLSAFELYEKEL